MQRSDFHYDLPPELIAQTPLAERRASRLLVLEGRTGALADGVFADLSRLLRPRDLLVFNDTRVLPARVFARKPTGGRVEILLERMLAPRRALVHLRASHKPQRGGEIDLPGGARARVGAASRRAGRARARPRLGAIPRRCTAKRRCRRTSTALPKPPTASGIKRCSRARRAPLPRRRRACTSTPACSRR